MAILTAYAAIGLFTALLYGVYWLRCKHKVEKPVAPDEMLMRALVHALIWPVSYWIMMRDGGALHFLNKVESFTPKLDDAYFARRAREWQDLIANLPVYGSHLVYEGTDIFSDPLPAKFIFDSDILTPYVFDAIGGNNTEQYCQERVLYQWLVGRDHLLQVCTPINSAFDRFEYIAAEMIKSGHGEVYCQECLEVYTANNIRCATEGATGSKGWILAALYCPKQHLLLRSKIMHFS